MEKAPGGKSGRESEAPSPGPPEDVKRLFAVLRRCTRQKRWTSTPSTWSLSVTGRRLRPCVPCWGEPGRGRSALGGLPQEEQQGPYLGPGPVGSLWTTWGTTATHLWPRSPWTRTGPPCVTAMWTTSRAGPGKEARLLSSHPRGRQDNRLENRGDAPQSRGASPLELPEKH